MPAFLAPSRVELSPDVVPSSFSGVDSTGTPPSLEWWLRLDDPVLNDIIELGLEQNPGLWQARYRLEQAVALRRVAAAGRWPTADLGANVSRQRQRFDFGPETFLFTQTIIDIAASAAFRLDLFGRNRAIAEASDWQRRAAGEDVDAARVMLSAGIAEAWYDLLTARGLLDLFEHQEDAARLQLTLLELRYVEGLAASADVRRQRLEVERLSAEQARASVRVVVEGLSLQMLLGGPPGLDGPVLPEGSALPELASIAGLGTPAELVARRPDLRAARARLEATEHRLIAVTAERLPLLSLSADGGLRARRLTDLLETPVWSLVASLTLPLFRAGELAARVDEQEAIRGEVVYAYLESLMAALGQVEMALARAKGGELAVTRLERARESSLALLDALEITYEEGLAEYFEVLSAREAALGIAREILQARREAILARIGLYSAIAGVTDSADQSIEAILETPDRPPRGPLE